MKVMSKATYLSGFFYVTNHQPHKVHFKYQLFVLDHNKVIFYHLYWFRIQSLFGY